MRVFHSIDDFEKVKAAVVTTGTFDGVHVGHRKIIARLNELAKNAGGESVILTFHPHPRMVLFPKDHGLELISTMDEKIELLKEAGVQNLIIHPFTKEFSRTTSLDFVRDIIVDKLGTQTLVIGYDHHFGRNREGSFEHLKEYGPLYGFKVEEISVQDVDDVAVSSTKIRRALKEGDVATAEKYLSFPFQLTGRVIHGDKLGRKLGFPTANLAVEDETKMIPANGVYAAYVYINGEKFKGMLNIGVRPTVEGEHQRIEVHIIDFDSEIYDKEISLHLKSKIRDEKKFKDLEQLKERLAIDRINALRVL